MDFCVFPSHPNTAHSSHRHKSILFILECSMPNLKTFANLPNSLGFIYFAFNLYPYYCSYQEIYLQKVSKEAQKINNISA